MKIATSPLKKVTPIFVSNPPLKIWGLVKHSPPGGAHYTLTTQRIKILKKWKNLEDIIILNKCTINDNHIMYSSWDMKCDRILCHFDSFLLFHPTNNPKKQNLKKMKRHLETSPFYTSVPKIMIICYNVPEIWHLRNVITIFHFGPFFALLHPNSPKNQN